MARRKVRYRAGDWFAVPLRDTTWAAGRIARVSGPILLGYFFGPRRETQPTLPDIEDLPAADAAYITQCGDLGLFAGEWPLLGGHEQFDPASWPVPPFRHVGALDGRPEIRRYGDDLAFLGSSRASPEEAKALPEEGTAGQGFVEIRLTQLLGGQLPPPASPKTVGVPTIRHFLYFTNRRAASRVASELRVREFFASVTSSGDQWLVVAAHAIPEAVEVESQEIARIASAAGGEYAGFERDVAPGGAPSQRTRMKTDSRPQDHTRHAAFKLR